MSYLKENDTFVLFINIYLSLNFIDRAMIFSSFKAIDFTLQFYRNDSC